MARQAGGIHPVQYLARLAAVAIAYWVAARLSLNLALVHGQVTPIWPPTGIALVTFLLLGRRMWPAIFLAAFAVNLPLGPSPLGAVLIACGNTLAPLGASEVLRRAGFRRQLDRMRDAIAIVLSALVGMMISATVGSAVLTLSGTVPMGRFASTWAVWWAGDAMGVLIVAPMLLSLLPRPVVRRLGWRGSAELTTLLAGVGVVTYFLFETAYRVEYLVLPLIAIAAWRFRLAGAAPAALIASVIAAWAAVNGVGPFASEKTLLEKMVTLQAFNVSVSLASFLLAAFADAHQQREDMARLYESARLAIGARTDAIDVAAHELGPPVALLTSYLAILSDGKLGPPPQKWSSILRVMADKAWQVDRIINELVDAARIEGNDQPPRWAYVDLREAVERAAERAGPRLDVSGAQITTTFGTEPVPVDADAPQIARILDNLINNSLTYTARPARLKLEVVTESKRAVVRVIDNGVGMTDAERARVFQPFQRTKDPAFRSVPGTGLGLYASRKLAEANQGRLTLVRTERGVGTCFALDLPLARVRSQPSLPSERPAGRG